jgi:mannosyltransferase
VSSVTADRRPAPVAIVLLVGLILLAIALRFYRLGAWGFESTEMFTLRDSIHLRPNNPRPLVYLLNYYLVRPLTPLDEFGLRLLPALFGVLATPLFYLVSRRLVGARAALFGTAMLTVSSFHVYYSQYARYWTLVFLLSAVYPYAIYLGLRERNRGALAVGLVTGVLAVMAHPVAVLLVGGLFLWLLASYVRLDQLSLLWQQKAVRWATLVVVVVGVAIAVRYIPVLRNWISERDTGKGGSFLLHIPSTPGVKQLTLLLGFVDMVTIPVVLAGVVGIYLLWQRDRPLARLLTCLWIFPVAFIFLLSFRTAVSTVYMIAATPVFFIGTGVFLDRLADVDWNLRPRWLLAATVMAIMIAHDVPTLISQYRDGRRWDFRGAAQWLEAQRAPGDVIYSDQSQVLQHYLPGAEVQRLRGDVEPLMETARQLREAGGGRALWVVMPGPSHAFRTNPNLGTLKGWLYQNCQLRNTIGVGRLDFRQNLLQIYRCPSQLPALAASP